MKTRSSFVANSSSSSFIIGCSKLPESVEDASEVWFGSKKDYVAPIVVRNLFTTLKEYKIDLDKMLEIAKSTKSIYWDDHELNNDNIENEILSEIASNLRYSKSYSSGYGRVTELEELIEKSNKKIEKKYPNTEWFNIPYSVINKTHEKVERKYYMREDILEQFVDEVEWFVNKFKKYPVLMEGEFEDDTEIGAECEHGDHWNKFPEYEKFSHH